MVETLENKKREFGEKMHRMLSAIYEEQPEDAPDSNDTLSKQEKWDRLFLHLLSGL